MAEDQIIVVFIIMPKHTAVTRHEHVVKDRKHRRSGQME